MEKDKPVSEIQFIIKLHIEDEFPGDEKAVREFISNLLKKTAQSVIDGGTQDDCGCSHIHENETVFDDSKNRIGFWFLQID